MTLIQEKLALKNFRPAGVRDVFVDGRDSAKPTLLSRNEQLRDEKGVIRSTKGHEISTIKSRLLQPDGLYLRRFFEGRSEPPARIVCTIPPQLRDRPPSGSSPN